MKNTVVIFVGDAKGIEEALLPVISKGDGAVETMTADDPLHVPVVSKTDVFAISGSYGMKYFCSLAITITIHIILENTVLINPQVLTCTSASTLYSVRICTKHLQQIQLSHMLSKYVHVQLIMAHEHSAIYYSRAGYVQLWRMGIVRYILGQNLLCSTK